MKRELKFRALCDYDCKEGTVTSMLYFGLPEMDNGLWAFPESKEVWHINEYESSLMQFTGLKDKNEKDIYEGDICESKYGLTLVIQYHNTACAFKPFLNGIPMEWSSYILEVVGNIYENVELLKGQTVK